jgi:hypothetical protein
MSAYFTSALSTNQSPTVNGIPSQNTPVTPSCVHC